MCCGNLQTRTRLSSRLRLSVYQALYRRLHMSGGNCTWRCAFLVLARRKVGNCAPKCGRYRCGILDTAVWQQEEARRRRAGVQLRYYAASGETRFCCKSSVSPCQSWKNPHCGWILPCSIAFTAFRPIGRNRPAPRHCARLDTASGEPTFIICTGPKPANGTACPGLPRRRQLIASGNQRPT